MEAGNRIITCRNTVGDEIQLNEREFNPFILAKAEGIYDSNYNVQKTDYTIIDGFHRWTVSGREPLLSKLGGKVPVVIVNHDNEADDIFGTITHNRARGTHLLEPMKAIVKRLIDEGKSVPEISKQLGMKPEEIFRLSDFSRDEFLAMMTDGVNGYSRAAIYKNV